MSPGGGHGSFGPVPNKAVPRQRSVRPKPDQAADIGRMQVVQAELELAVQELMFQNRQLVRGLPETADRLGLPSILCDSALRVTDCNAAARDLTGLQPGHDLAVLLPAPEADALRAALWRRPGELRPPLVLTLPGHQSRHRAEVFALEEGFQLWLVPLGLSSPEVSQFFLMQCLDEFSDELVIHDLSGEVLYANRKASHAPPLMLHESLQHQDMARRVLADRKGLTRPVERGPSVQVVVSKFPLLDADGRLLAVATRVHDATVEIQQHADLQFSSQVLEQSLDAILVTDARLRIRTVNPAFQGLTGFGGTTIRGRALETILTQQSLLSNWGTLRKEIADFGRWQGELSLRTASGEEVAVWCSASRLSDEMGKVIGHVLIQSDLTRLRQIQKENEVLARFDTLTGLPNRKLMLDRLAEILVEAQQNDHRFSVLFIDLDSFKSINDSLGHATGDLVLVAVARRLATALRLGGTVGRIGGDEFVVLLPGCDEAQARAVAHDLLDACAVPMTLEGMADYRPTASVGIALYPEHGNSGDELLRSADTAMYAAKAGHARLATFRPAMLQAAATLLDLRNALNGALERGEFELYYQPIFRLSDGAITGAEALLRWQRPGHGLVLPSDFLETAEVTGLMRAIDAWVLRRALADLGTWRRNGLVGAGWRMSVNQTADDLSQQGWVQGLTAALHVAGLSGDDPGLQVELTEGHMAGTREALRISLSEMERLGVRLAVDDFGTGYSNLAYLRRLPITMLKIDKVFVSGLDEDPDAQVLARAMIGLGEQFGYEILAEGIETEEQRKALMSLGCRLGQGYLIAQPMPAADFIRLLSEPARL